MRNILFILAVLLFLSNRNISAQGDSLKNRVSFEPFYLTMNGIRINYERHLKKGHWLEIGPQFYASENESKTSKYNSLKGLGTSVYYKSFLDKKKRGHGTYIAFGGMMCNYWIEYPHDKLISKTNFPKFGGDVIVGYNFATISDMITAEIYAGLGYRYANTKNPYILSNFTDFYTSYAWTGNIMVLGAKIGFSF